MYRSQILSIHAADWAFLSREALDAVVMRGRPEQPPEPRHRYLAFTDPAGGSGTDAMTVAIAHRHGDQAVLGAVRETWPPFSPDATVRPLLLDAGRGRCSG